jgi:hypothetical protein
MGQVIAGTCYVKVDGAQLTINGGCEAPLMAVKRETVVPGFYKETDVAPSFKVTALHTADFPLKKLIEGTDITVTCEFSNGKSTCWPVPIWSKSRFPKAMTPPSN